MSIERKTQLKLNLSDGSVSVINLPAPFNDDMRDEDSGNYLYPDAHAAIVAAFATDTNATIDSIDYSIVVINTTKVAEAYTGA